MEPFAFVYGPGPMIVSEGLAVGAVDNTDPPGQITQMVKPVPSVPNPHPVEMVEPRVLTPPASTNISCADELKTVVPGSAEESEKSTSLTSWPADVGFASRSRRMTVKSPSSVVNVADALTLPAGTDDPDGVENVMVAPETNGLTVNRQKKREANLHNVSCIEFPGLRPYGQPVKN